MARGRIALPAAVLPDGLARAIGAETRVVRLSVADGAKQARKRVTGAGEPSVEPPDYAIVQRLVDDGEVIRQGAADLVVQGRVDGRWWVAVLRRAASAVNEVYLKSFRRLTPRQVELYRTRGKMIRPAAEGSPPVDGGTGSERP